MPGASGVLILRRARLFSRRVLEDGQLPACGPGVEDEDEPLDFLQVRAHLSGGNGGRSVHREERAGCRRGYGAVVVGPVDDAGENAVPVREIHVLRRKSALRSSQGRIGFSPFRNVQKKRRFDPVEVVPGGEQTVSQLGHEHGRHKRRRGKNRFLLQRDCFDLKQHVIALPEGLVVSSVGCEGVFGSYFFSALPCVASAEALLHGVFSLLQRGALPCVVDALHREDAEADVRIARLPVRGYSDHDSIISISSPFSFMIPESVPIFLNGIAVTRGGFL